MNIRYSEIFGNFQGEAYAAGEQFSWVRFFNCNLKCEGFSQPDPTNPKTYIREWEQIKVTNKTKLEDLPIFKYGCDSALSHRAEFKKLAKKDSVKDVCTKLENVTYGGKFENKDNFTHTHLAFTGGEPLMSQREIAAILEEFHERDNYPRYITVETNGTQKLKDVLLKNETIYNETIEWMWSVSPKLFTVSGEPNKRAIKPEILAEYANMPNSKGYLKFVIANKQECWDEFDNVLTQFRQAGIKWPVWIMPVGGLKEQQEGDDVREIAEEATRRGLNVSSRSHVHICGNKHGA